MVDMLPADGSAFLASFSTVFVLFPRAFGNGFRTSCLSYQLPLSSPLVWSNKFGVESRNMVVNLVLLGFWWML